MPPASRLERRDDVTARIIEIGRRHLAEHGAAALSLRAVTRDLGMVSSAVYRYVASRDELLTVLLVDAYTELGDAVDAAVEAAARSSWDRRLLRAGEAVRAWAVAEPARYALLYGSPVPGYHAPSEVTVEPGTRVIRRILGLVVEGVSRGEVVTSSPVPMGRVLRRDLARVRAELDVGLSEPVLARTTLLWAALFGAVSLEVFGQYGADTFTAPEALFTHQLQLAIDGLKGRSVA